MANISTTENSYTCALSNKQEFHSHAVLKTSTFLLALESINKFWFFQTGILYNGENKSMQLCYKICILGT